MNRPAIPAKSILIRTIKFHSRMKWIFLIVCLLIGYSAVKRHIRTIRYFKSGKRYVQQHRDETIRDAERLMNITMKLNGLNNKVDLSEYKNHTKKISFQYDQFYSYFTSFAKPDVAIRMAPISYEIRISNTYFKEKIKNGKIDIAPLPNMESETEEYIWKQGEKILYSYFPKTEYPDYEFKRGRFEIRYYSPYHEILRPERRYKTANRSHCMDNPSACGHYLHLFWKVYCNGNQVLPGEVSIDYFYDRGFSEIRFNLCDCHRQHVTVTQNQARQKAWKRASFYAHLISGVKTHIYSTRLIQMPPDGLYCMVQPVYTDMKQNETHRLMYEIYVGLVDHEYNPNNKSDMHFFNHMKGIFQIYVDAETGEIYTNDIDYGGVFNYCPSNSALNLFNFYERHYNNWLERHHPELLRF